MTKIIVSGIGTDVGKTVVSAILTSLFKGDYWKPVESGTMNNSDPETLKHLLDCSEHRIFDPVYSFKPHVSPHHAARLENITIDPSRIIPPKTSRPLIIEGVGGIFVPFKEELTCF